MKYLRRYKLFEAIKWHESWVNQEVIDTAKDILLPLCDDYITIDVEIGRFKMNWRVEGEFLLIKIEHQNKSTRAFSVLKHKEEIERVIDYLSSEGYTFKQYMAKYGLGGDNNNAYGGYNDIGGNDLPGMWRKRPRTLNIYFNLPPE